MTTATHEPPRLPTIDGLSDIVFTVHGVPATAGSKRAFPFKRKNGTLGAHVTEDNERSKPWMAAVAAAARDVFTGDLLRGAIELTLDFRLPRPKGHFGSGRNPHQVLRQSAPRHKITKPDLSKMTRAVEDALTGVVWHDDAQIVREILEKDYGEPACCSIRIRALE